MMKFVNYSENNVQTGIDFLEGAAGTFIKDTLSWETVVLVEIVGCHTSSELSKIGLAVLEEDVLSWRTLIFSWEAIL